MSEPGNGLIGAPLEPGHAPIDALVRPRSIAVVGASPRSYVGRVLCENLRGLGYEGAVFPVNPRYQEVAGWRCYPSVDALPRKPDAVVAAISFDLVPGILRAAAEMGTRAAVVPGGGFTETGPRALEIQNEVVSVATEFGLEVCGPNCMGVIAPAARSAMYIGTLAPSLLPGRVALLSQSGSVVEAAVNMGPRVGFSALVSYGNEAVTTAGRYLRYFADDDATGAVAMFIEGFRDAAGFVDGARALRDAGKPLAVLKAGRSRQAGQAIAAHSGSLAGVDEVVTGLLHQLGAIGVDDLDELLEVAEVMAHGRMPAGRRIFVVTDSGGEANLVADHIERAGLEAPPPSERLVKRLRARWPNFSYLGNPIDPWGVDPDYSPLYSEILLAAAEEDVDVLAVALDKVTPWAGENEVDLGAAGAEALIAAARGTDKMPVFFTVHATGPAAEAVRERLRAAGVPLLHGLRPAMVALRRTWWWQQWKPRSGPSGPGHPDAKSRAQSLDPRDEGPVLSERASRDILDEYGIPLVRSEVAVTAEGAADAAERIGFPVVAKADVPGLAHKAAAGLVATGIVSPRAAAAAFDVLTRRATSRGTPARGVLIQATASGVELICGMRRDVLFGPVVLIGVGGTLTEVLRQVAVRVCPVAPEDLDELLAECPAGVLLAAAGAPADPVLGVVSALSRLGIEHPEIQEIDVNPLFAGPDGVVAADALVALSTAHAGSTVA